MSLLARLEGHDLTFLACLLRWLCGHLTDELPVELLHLGVLLGELLDHWFSFSNLSSHWLSMSFFLFQEAWMSPIQLIIFDPELILLFYEFLCDLLHRSDLFDVLVLEQNLILHQIDLNTWEFLLQCFNIGGELLDTRFMLCNPRVYFLGLTINVRYLSMINADHLLNVCIDLELFVLFSQHDDPLGQLWELLLIILQQWVVIFLHDEYVGTSLIPLLLLRDLFSELGQLTLCLQKTFFRFKPLVLIPQCDFIISVDGR